MAKKQADNKSVGNFFNNKVDAKIGSLVLSDSFVTVRGVELIFEKKLTATQQKKLKQDVLKMLNDNFFGSYEIGDIKYDGFESVLKLKVEQGGVAGPVPTAIQEAGSAFILTQVLRKNKKFASAADILNDNDTKKGLEKIFKAPYDKSVNEWIHSYFEHQKAFFKKFQPAQWDVFEHGGQDLMEFVKGPDFPTGGSILGRAGIIDAYRTGRGSVKMRATATIDEGKSGRMEIIVTELPYQTSCSAIAARITELVDNGDIEGIADINDGSSGGETSLVITLKRDANANVVLNNLFKLTQLQTSFSINMVALVDGVPRTLNLRDAIDGYVRHQIEVITRRSNFRLEKAKRREHILDGRIKALNVIDEIIALIRGSEDAQAAKAALMEKPYEFSEAQAVDILDMQLRQLTRLSRIDIESELESIRENIKELESILADDKKLRGVIKDEIGSVRNDFAADRVCAITYDEGEMSIEDLVEDKELVVVMTEAQYVKAVSASSFKTQGRGGRGVSGGKLKQDDIIRHVIFTTAHAHLLFFSNRGRVYRLRALDIPERERTAKGMPIVNLLPLQADEFIQAIIDTRDFAGERFLFFATRKGTVKKTAFDAYNSSRRDGLIAINLNEDDELVRVIETSGTDDIFMVAKSGMTIRFNEGDVRAMGRSAAGVRGMKLKTGDDAVVSCDVARDDTAILLMTEAGFGKRTQLDKFNTQGRGGQGVRGIKLTGKKGVVAAAFMVGIEDEIVAVSSGGVTIRMEVREISSQGRDATGVRIMNLDDGQTVASVAPIIAGE